MQLTGGKTKIAAWEFKPVCAMLWLLNIPAIQDYKKVEGS